MELILISNTKLKIMLNESDMRKYHIGSESDCAQITTRKAIRTLLDCAKDQIGFNTDGEEIFVQLYTSKHGGCELFVTKCHAEAKSEELPARVKSPISSGATPEDEDAKKRLSLPSLPSLREEITAAEKKETKIAPKPRKERGARIAFSFSRLSDMISVCKILVRSDVKTESRAFADERGCFYLLLPDAGMSAYSRLDKLTFILEFGKRENPDCLVSYIPEHGRVICHEKAIETLSRF